jgi:hypothetical protein
VAQHDYVIANGTGAAVRSDLNNALAAIVSQNSGATEPTTTYAYMRWADTTAGVMKMRNGANNAWITLYQLDGEWSTIAFENGSASAPSIYFKDSGTDTGIYSPGTDQVAISTAGTGRLFVDASGNVGLGTSSPGAKLQVSQNTDAGTAISVISASASTGLTTDFASLFLQNTNTTNNNYNAIGFVNDQGGYSSAIYGIYTSHTSGSQSGALAFSTSNAGTFDERMRITAAGNVGIGTTSPSSPLVVSNGGANGFEIQASSTVSYLLSYNRSTSAYTDLRFDVAAARFEISGTERARIDSSGRLLVGTSSTSSTALFQVQGNSSSSTGEAIVQLRRGTNNVGIINGNSLGKIEFSNTESTVSAVIEAVADANWNTTDDYPSRLTFSTTADGGSSPTERMRIDSSGRLLVGTTSVVSAGSIGIQIKSTSASASNIESWNEAASGTIFHAVFRDGASATSRGSITTNGSATAFNTSSDYRLKENVVPLTGAVDRLQQIPVHRFNFIADPNKTVDGFIAHEAQEVVPECVTGEKDAVDDEGNPVYQGIDQSKLVPLLTAALQEAIAEIGSLKDRVAALEAS